MSLSAPVAREARHHRRIACDGYRRTDGLWDIEAHLVDTKPFGFRNRDREGGRIEAGEPLHEMWLRVTVDDTLLIHAVEAVTDAGPFAICPRITDNFRRLEGERIGPGWRRRVRELVGGADGCTHLRELLTPLATTAFQTIYGSGYADTSNTQHEQGQGGGSVMKFLVGSCHALAPDSEVVRDFWPRYYRPDPSSRED